MELVIANVKYYPINEDDNDGRYINNISFIYEVFENKKLILFGTFHADNETGSFALSPCHTKVGKSDTFATVYDVINSALVSSTGVLTAKETLEGLDGKIINERV